MQGRTTRLAGERAIVAARSAEQQPDPTEMERLARAAGYEVIATFTQRRPEDPGTWLGRGKAEAVAATADEADADTVLVDGGLSPGQYANLVELLPQGVGVIDRYRLVLDIFADGAADRRAALQVEAATLEYDLPRLRQVTEESMLTRATEKGSPVLDAERHIDRIRTELDDLSAAVRERHQQRRAAGCGLVAIAGYTNAGKTTLLRRLADNRSVEDGPVDHPDIESSAPVEDRLFVTLETITRRGDLSGVDVLYTDTVGLIDGLPHDLVESFSATLDEIAEADVVVLVVDATDTPDRIDEKVRVALEAFGDLRGELIVALNKIDQVADLSTVTRRVTSHCERIVPVSALEGTGLPRLRERIHEALPIDRATFRLENSHEAQEFLAWAHEHGAVETAYRSDVVRVTIEGRPEILEEARNRADPLSLQGSTTEEG